MKTQTKKRRVTKEMNSSAMTIVKSEDGFCTIKLNEYFYPKELVLQAVDEFKESVEIEFDSGVVRVNDHEAEFVSAEFCNYVLGLVANDIMV